MEAYSSLPFISDASRASKLEQLSDEQFWSHARSAARQEPSLASAHEYLECLLPHNRCLISFNALNEVCLAPHQYAFLPAMPWWVNGLTTWHSEVIVVVDLNAYLTGQMSHASAADGMLLIAHSGDTPLGFHVCAVGQTIAVEHSEAASIEAQAAAWLAPSRTMLVKETRADAVILDFPALLADVTKHIETTLHDG